MASRAGKNNFLDEFLFREKETKLFVYKKHSASSTAIKEHVRNVQEFVKLFTFGENERKEELQLFQKYFDEEINKEIQSDPSYNHESENIEDYTQRLLKMLEKKESKISNIRPLFQITQAKNESITDYAKRIRIGSLGIKEMKEDIMIEAFLEGMAYRTMATIVRLFKPKSLEEAIDLIKDEQEPMRLVDDDQNLYHMKHDREHMKQLKLENEKLKNEIIRLKAIIAGTRNKPQYKQYESRYATKDIQPYSGEKRTCFNCKKIGHIAKFCKERKCYGCGSTNHVLRDCSIKRLRYFQEEEEEILSDGPPETNNVVSEDKQINMIHGSGCSKEKSKMIFNKKPTLEEAYSNYINNHGARPRKNLYKYEPTLISESRPEKARNKPIVRCNTANMPVKVIFDTGADPNVISQELVDKIRERNPAVKIYDSRTKITCANGTTEECIGKVQLNVAIGPHITAHVFDIMPKIFPHIFIGLRSMKKYEIKINAGEDCIEIQNMKIPFISKTITAESLN